MSQNWEELTVAPGGTHHLIRGRPAYGARFTEVLKFHVPGLAAVRDKSGAYHIDIAGCAAYAARYARTFGFYEGRAAVQNETGWSHILADGSPLYQHRYAWCGNFQEGRCTVRHADGGYFHIGFDGRPVYEPRYRYAGDYHDGSAVVQTEDGLHTHIDPSGDILHGRWFRDLDVFHKGYARACDEAGWHHVDLEGQPAYHRRFKAVEPFYNGQARVEHFDGSLLVIDESGAITARLSDPTMSPLEQLSSDLVGFWRTQTIRATVELGVFEVLPAAAADIDRRLGLAGTATRLLRALCELGLAYENGEGTWLPTERGLLLRKAHDYSMATAAIMWGKEHYDAWADLADALRTGHSVFEDRYGKPFFQWLLTRPSDLELYHSALSSYARHDYASLSGIVDLSGHRAVLDAGGGRGELLFSLLRWNPGLQGVLLDSPEVIAGVNKPDDIKARCRLVAGDLFAPWPARSGAIVLARVVHDWEDHQALLILKRAREALCSHGRLYIIEMVLQEGAVSGGMLDLNMLVMTGGRERTRKQFEKLLHVAGFRMVELGDTPSVVSVLIAELL